MTEKISIVNLEPQLVLGMRKRGPYESIAKMIPEICQFAVQNGIQMIGPPIFICHETTAEEAIKADKEKNADVEVAVPISQRGQETEEIKCYELPGGEMAKTVYKGPYQDVGSTYQKLFAWLGKNGKRISGPTREVYMNDPHEVPQEELLTEIYAPIKPLNNS